MFFLQWNSSPLFAITRSNSFSVTHVSVHSKNNVEKDTTLLLFFLSKSPGGHAFSCQIKPSVAFGSPYLLFEFFFTLACLCCGRMGGRAGGPIVMWLPKFLGCIGNRIFLLMVLRCACFARERAPLWTPIRYVTLHFRIRSNGVFRTVTEIAPYRVLMCE